MIGEEGGAGVGVWRRASKKYLRYLGCCPRVVEAIACSRIPWAGSHYMESDLEGGRLHPKNRDLFWSEWLSRSSRISSVCL